MNSFHLRDELIKNDNVSKKPDLKSQSKNSSVVKSICIGFDAILKSGFGIFVNNNYESIEVKVIKHVHSLKSSNRTT